MHTNIESKTVYEVGPQHLCRTHTKGCVVVVSLAFLKDNSVRALPFGATTLHMLWWAVRQGAPVCGGAPSVVFAHQIQNNSEWVRPPAARVVGDGFVHIN